MAGAAQAGVSAGAAFGPWGAVAGGAAGAAVDIAGSGKPAGPSDAGLFGDSRMSNSGWVVSTSGSSATGNSNPTDSGMTPTTASGYGIAGSPALGTMGGSLSWTTIALIAAGLFLVMKK